MCADPAGRLSLGGGGLVDMSGFRGFRVLGLRGVFGVCGFKGFVKSRGVFEGLCAWGSGFRGFKG